jgi:hypothetical protein
MKKSFKSLKTFTRDKTILAGESSDETTVGSKSTDKKESPLSVVCWNLIPFAVATGTYFLVYIFLPGGGYLHIFYSLIMALGVLGVLEGLVSGIPVRRDLSLYVVLLVFVLAGFTAINYQYKNVSPTPNQLTVSDSTPAPVVYGPGVYHFSLGPGERSISFIVSGDYYYETMASSNDYIIIANGIRYRPSKKLIIPWASTTQLMLINNKKKSNNIILIVKYR